MKKTPEDVCIEYAIVVGFMRTETAKIKPWECERITVRGWHPSGIADPPCDPCINTLLKKAGPFTYMGAQEEHREWQEEFEEEMCDRCKVSLQAIRDRKALRMRLGAAKRSITAIGKRLNKAATA